MKYIGVFCSASEVEEKYIKAATAFAQLLASSGYGLVWGGSDKGIMKIVADEVEKGGGKLVGISVEFLQDVVRKKADEMIITKNLSDRKATLLERSDAIVMLVGGIGTLDEVAEMLEHKKHGHHNKPVVILNTAGFYDGLKLQIEKMIREGFINKTMDEFVYFADAPQRAIEYITGKLKI